MTIECVILGAGGHGRVVLDALRRLDEVRVAGFVDPAVMAEVDGVPVLGGDDSLPSLRDRGITHFVVGVGSARDNSARASLFARARDSGFAPLTVIHPTAVVASSATLGPGCFLGALSVVNPGATLEENVLVNTSAIVEHDCRVGRHVHVASGACLAGNVSVGELAHIGAGAIVKQGVRIGARAVVGVGAAVIDDVGQGDVVGGVPARPLGQ